MKIIIAGVNGIIGTFLYEKLRLEHTVTGLGSKEKSNVSDYYSIDLLRMNLVENLVENLPKYDVLIYLVGLAHKKGKGKDIAEFRNINKQTLVNFLSILDKRNKLPEKIIFASTISVYGEKIDNIIYTEESQKDPFSPYAITKLEAEEYLIKNYISKSWLLRFAPVYEKNFQLNIDRRTKVLKFNFRVSGGVKKLSLCNIENIGIVIESIIRGKIPTGVYNVSDTVAYSYNDLLKYVKSKRAIPIPSILAKGLLLIGEKFDNVFLKENMTKLISDNIFVSSKVNKLVKLNATLENHFNSE